MSRPGNPRRQYVRPPPFMPSGNVASPQFRNDLARPEGAGLRQPELIEPKSQDQRLVADEDLHGGRDFYDSSLWRGKFWPYRRQFNFKLAAGQSQPFFCGYPGRMQVMVTTSAGIASFWLYPADPVTDPFHFQVAPQAAPFLFSLPPGRHQFAILADSGQACTSAVMILGMPPEDWDTPQRSP